VQSSASLDQKKLADKAPLAQEWPAEAKPTKVLILLLSLWPLFELVRLIGPESILIYLYISMGRGRPRSESIILCALKRSLYNQRICYHGISMDIVHVWKKIYTISSDAEQGNASGSRHRFFKQGCIISVC